jgi:Mn2+/Fe2+ NRAMP family transporter
MKALYWSAVINGIVAVPVMAVMMLMACRREIMGEVAVSGWLRAVGWAATLVMGAAAITMLVNLAL